MIISSAKLNRTLGICRVIGNCGSITISKGAAAWEDTSTIDVKLFQIPTTAAPTSSINLYPIIDMTGSYGEYMQADVFINKKGLCHIFGDAESHSHTFTIGNFTWEWKI